MYNYYYDTVFKCLRQCNESGEVIQSMSMPEEDLQELKILAWVVESENIYKNMEISNRVEVL